MSLKHKLLHRFNYVFDCRECAIEKADYDRLDAAIGYVLPKMNAELEAAGSDLRLKVSKGMFTEIPITPVRLCCGQRHLGPVCPDGKVMCQLCFNRFEIEDLFRDAHGDFEDICKACADLENDINKLGE